jgi:hypothetical protein
LGRSPPSWSGEYRLSVLAQLRETKKWAIEDFSGFQHFLDRSKLPPSTRFVGVDLEGLLSRTPPLIEKSLSEIHIPGCGTEIGDLTTTVETKHLVSYFTKVYPAFGYGLDLALNFFGENIMPESGFMLTFPRGKGNFQVVQAFPPESLQMSTSFFNLPVAGSGQPFAHGLLIFQDMSKVSDEEKPTRIGVYLAQAEGDMGGDLGGQWMCMLTHVSDDVNMYEKCKGSWQFEHPDVWGHYDDVGRFLVAARTKFALQQPTPEAVMVEIVFDADVLSEEQDLNTSTVQFSN